MDISAELAHLDKALTAVTASIRQPIQIGDGEVDETLLAYYEELRAQAEDARRRNIEQAAFLAAMLALIARYLRRLFLTGTQTADFPDILAQVEFEQARRIHDERAETLSQDIYNGRYDPENEDDSAADDALALILASRMALWANKAAEMYALGQLHNPAVPRYGWELGATDTHCGDCRRLNGQVHSREAWLASGWRPQGSNLECNGFHCDCSFVPTRAAESGEF